MRILKEALNVKMIAGIVLGAFIYQKLKDKFTVLQ